VQMAVRIIAVGILAVIAYGDLRTRRIPNTLSLAIAILGLFRLVVIRDTVSTQHTFVVGIAVFALAFLLFWYGAVGGGDAKLVAAMALLIDHHNVLDFLFLMSLCGGALALAVLAHDKLGPQVKGLSRLPGRLSEVGFAGRIAAPTKSTVPYGVAIAIAGIYTLLLPMYVMR
jgi:prepilin peptidase CpaA